MRSLFYLLVCCCLWQDAQGQFTATITPSGPTSFCQGDSVYLIANAGDTYQWFWNGSPIAGAINDSLLVTSWGNYSVFIQSGVNSNTSNPVFVSVANAPTNAGIASNPPPNPFCSGDSVIIGVSVVHTGDSFTFFKNGNIVSTNTVGYYWVKQSGTYSAVVTNSAGCSASTNSLSFTVQPGPPPPTIIQAGPTLTTTQGYNCGWFLNYNYVGFGQYYYPTQNGYYMARVCDSIHCCSQSSSYNVTYTGVDEIEHGTTVYIVPNPTSGVFRLAAEIPESKEAAVSIIDITGRTVLIKNIPVKNGLVEETVILNDNTPAGVYYIRLISENYNKVTSFVKQ